MNENQITPATLETLLSWSQPRTTTTYRGPCTIRTAEPTGKFWALWKTNKPALQAMKISPKLLTEENRWVVNWYQDLTPSTPAPVVLPVKGEISWSPEQQAIFGWFRDGSGCLVVRARAGTGKTTTIKAAFTHAREERMLYAIFNKKNQVEAAAKISDPRVEVKTLHSLGFMFIQQVWPNSKPSKDLETERVESVVGEQSPSAVKTQVRKLVSFAKNILISPSLAEMIELAEERDIEATGFENPVNGGYDRTRLAQLALQVLELSKTRDAQGRISFDDMVWLPVAMSWVRAWYDLVVVDECQDMNLPQLMMAKAACKPEGRVCVVGDDCQAIYHFRGAAADGLDLMKNLLRASELGLTVTRRCPKVVVNIAVALVPDFKAAPEAPEGSVEEMEVAGMTAKLQVGDAVLSRANAPLMTVCLSLLRKGTPARIEGKDLGKTLIDIVEKLKARTVPQFLTKIEAWGEKQIARFDGTKNFEAKAEQINDQVRTLQAVAEGASSVREIVNRIGSLFQDSDENAKPAVVLSTVHKAKGLEWDRVFILSATFNRRPAKNAAPVSEELAEAQAREERNIYYVAVTRTKQTLVTVRGEIR